MVAAPSAAAAAAAGAASSVDQPPAPSRPQIILSGRTNANKKNNHQHNPLTYATRKNIKREIFRHFFSGVGKGFVLFPPLPKQGKEEEEEGRP